LIPNIVKGKGISGALNYALGQGNDPVTGERLTLAEGEKTRAEILGGQNFGFEIDSAERLEIARRTMEWNGKPENQASKGIKCVKDCLNASLSWEPGQSPSKAEMIEAAQSFLKSLGMENAQAVFVAHHDTDHKHIHIVASRIDPDSGKTYSQLDDRTKAQAWALTWEREHGQIPQNEKRRALHRLVDAIEARNGAAIVEALTERTPTFTARELDKALSYGTLSKAERAEFRGAILADQNVIGLREEAEGPVKRYTTREVLAAEMALQRNAQRLANDHSHGLSDGRVAATSAAHTLKPEQAEALAHLTGAEGFAMLWGEAGTGKSHTLNATRAAYEAQGVKVIGLSWTNDVVQSMRADGFSRANTIASELKKLEKGRAQWDKNTVLIVDEAAMIATEHLAALTAAAGSAGAKLILAGDDHQLSSIERGGMFETLRQTHGAAILKDVQRVKEADQKAAFGKMHEGEFLGALQTFDKAGGIHWAEKQTDALRDMAVKYTADLAASPDKRRFMFAFTNAEVDGLNDYARILHQRRGDLGADRELATATGAKEFATGDRIQFTGNGYSQRDKLAGFTNGRVGTITEIDTSGPKPCVTVELDTAKGKEPQRVSFTVGDDAEAGEFNRFKRGYAGTIYRGQGKTLDQTYVCHSAQWKSSAAYVALTRHRESVEIFAAHETVPDLDAMARGMGRKENKRAATAYRIDAAHLARAGFGQAALEATAPKPTVQAFQPMQEPAQPATAPVAFTEQRSGALEAFTGKETSRAAEGLATAASGVVSFAANLMGGVASIFEGLLGGAPSPEQVAQAKEDARTATTAPASRAPSPERGPVDPVDAFLEAERQQRAAMRALDAIARVAGPPDITPETASKKDRDRDEGQSL
jgi:hypothetical protein